MGTSPLIRHIHNKFPDPVITKFRRRIYERDNDVFAIFAGGRGTCKSGSAISLGCQVDITNKGYTRFYLDKKYYPKGFKLKPGEFLPRLIYKPSQLLDMLKNHKKYPMGTCIIWDEVGVEGDAREFTSKKNKLLKRTFQTIRSLNWFIELTAVTIKDFDVAFERNAGFYIRMDGAVNLTKIVNGKPKKYPCAKAIVKEIEVSPTTGKKYYKFLNYKDVDNQIKVLSEYYYIKKPPAYMENPYKRYKELFQTTLYTSYAEELDNIADFSIDDNTLNDVALVDAKIEEILGDISTYFDFKRKRFVLSAIQYEGEIKLRTESRAKKIQQLLNFKVRKGDIDVSA